MDIDLSFPTDTTEIVFSDGLAMDLAFSSGPTIELNFSGTGPSGADGQVAPLCRVVRGENISAARGVYLVDDGGTVKCFTASATDPTKAAIGFVTTAGATGEEVDVWRIGSITGLSGIEVNATYFLGANGAFVRTLPSGVLVWQKMGIGVSSTEIGGNVSNPVYYST